MGGENEVNGCSELEWLDSVYLNNILNAYEGKSVILKAFNKKPATSKGENYASAMHLVSVEYAFSNGCSGETKKISMIVKSRLCCELMDQIEDEFNVFEREAQVYRCIMTSCEKLLQNSGDCTLFGPRALYVDDRVIVQENLKEKGYAISNVKKGLDYEECRKVLEKIAKFHASTMVLYQKNPNLFINHENSNVSEKYTPLHDLYKNAMETCLDYIKTIPELQQYETKLDAFRKNIIQNLSNVFSRNPTGINVLNHGDAWVNNFMFKKDASGKILDLLLVDYQEGYFGSPGIDLNYFMYSSWQTDVYINRKDDLIKWYHSVLENTLRQLNYDHPLPTLNDILKEIRLKSDHGVTTATCLLPILISDRQDLTDPSTFLVTSDEGRQNRLAVFRNEKFANLLKIFLSDFVSQGFL